MLTAIVALALPCARGLWRHTSGPSTFFEDVDPFELCQVAGTAHDASFFRGDGGGYGDEVFVFENHECHSTGGPNRSRVVAELKRVVLRKLAEFHCTVLDSMPSSDRDELSDFVIEYAWRGRRGSIVVASFSEPDDEFCVLMTRHEATVAQQAAAGLQGPLRP